MPRTEIRQPWSGRGTSRMDLPFRDVPLGGVRGVRVRRYLPHRQLPTVGAWCFLDVVGPTHDPADVLPHPHIGLQTVTWPLSGAIHHRDTIGSDVVVSPGVLNLMTSGPGIAHSEIVVRDPAPLHFAQLWVALPDSARHSPGHFERHANLPRLIRGNLTATVLMGELEGLRSPAGTYTPLVGADLQLAAGTESIGLRGDFEYAVLPLTGTVRVGDRRCEPGTLSYLGDGLTAFEVSSDAPARMLLLGGEPFREDLVMWWNFVARSHEEVAGARDDWEAHSSRFGEIPAHGADRIPAPPMPAVRLTPRRRPTGADPR